MRHIHFENTSLDQSPRFTLVGQIRNFGAIVRLDAQVRVILAGGKAIPYVWGSFTYEILLPLFFAPDRLIPLGKVFFEKNLHPEMIFSN